ncbi:MAG TPA: hypothetical protein VF883_08340 [Thermoanaerobaculia bacterium]|jgi:hypothetical protein
MIVLFIVTGLAAATFVPHALPRFVAGRVAAAFLLGVGVNGAVLFAIGTLNVPLRPITFAAISLIALVIIGIHWRCVVRGIRWRGNVHELASTAVILLPFVILLWTTSIVPLADYDGRATWMPKAWAIVDEASIHGPFFRGERGLNLHNRYPLLMPLNAASLMAMGGDARPLYVLLAPAMLLAARDLLTRRFGFAWASWCMAALAWLPQLVVAPEGGATSAYSDLAVAAFFGMAVATRVSRGRRASGAAALWCAFLILTKNEGLLLAAAVILYKPRWQLLVAPAIAFTILVAWQRTVPEAYDERNGALLLELPRRIAMLDDATIAIGKRALDFRTWGALWPLVLLGVVFRRRPAAAVIPLLLVLAGYIAALACTSWNIEELARVTAHRLLLHCIIPAGCIVLALLANQTASSSRTSRGE